MSYPPFPRRCLPALLLLLGLSLGGAGAAQAQTKYLTRTGRVTFFSASIMEDIEARNEEAAAAVDLGAAQLAFSIPIRGFKFKRTLMQEHFNENYMESEKYPKSTFSGKFTDLSLETLQLPGAHPVHIEGDLTIHGVTKHISVPASVELKEGHILAFALFTVAPADYAIDVPLLVRDHIAKTVSIRVALTCDVVPAAPGRAAN
ncbi:YceI family protein [uncultured Hymenobacter sp.]|uniref:YceI family protein n=1 Tax=uncultured Hymenobacter sp. TaxID=170016 RepID=UPI0035CBD87E